MLTHYIPYSTTLHYITLHRLVENIAFLIGSAYFVAGSYPDGAMVIDDDFLDTSVEEGGFYLRGGKVSTHASDDELGGNSNNALEMLAGRGV